MIRNNSRGAALFAILAAATAAHSQTAVSSSLDIAVQVFATQASTGPASVYHDDQTTTLNPLGQTVSATDTVFAQHLNTVHAECTAQATWMDAGEGDFTMRNTGWLLDAPDGGAANINGSVSSNTNVPIWTYTFVATASGTFNLDYEVTARGVNRTGLNGIFFGWSGPGGGDGDDLNGNDPTGTGSFSRVLVGGQQYTISAGHFAGIAAAAPFDASFDADVHWKVNAVPEPASLCALGLGALALLRRRLA